MAILLFSANMLADESRLIIQSKEGERISSDEVLTRSAKWLRGHGENADMQMVTSKGEWSSATVCFVGARPIGVLALSHRNPESSDFALLLTDANKGELPKSFSMTPWIPVEWQITNNNGSVSNEKFGVGRQIVIDMLAIKLPVKLRVLCPLDVDDKSSVREVHEFIIDLKDVMVQRSNKK